MADSSSSRRQVLVLALIALGILAVFAIFIAIAVIKGDDTGQIDPQNGESAQILPR